MNNTERPGPRDYNRAARNTSVKESLDAPAPPTLEDSPTHDIVAVLQRSSMMTIADIYDALTATDRPYKRAVPSEHALQILELEAREGMLDATLLAAFIGARIFEQVPLGSAGDD